MSDWLAVGTFAYTVLIGLLVAAKQLGFLEGKAQAPHDDHDRHHHRSNGTPTLGEVARRLAELEQERAEYLTEKVASVHLERSRQERADLWAAVKRLEDADKAIGHRIDRLMEQST